MRLITWCQRLIQLSKMITCVTLHEFHGISELWKLDGLLNTLFGLISKKISKFNITFSLNRESTGQRSVMQKAYPWHDVITIWQRSHQHRNCPKSYEPSPSPAGGRNLLINDWSREQPSTASTFDIIARQPKKMNGLAILLCMRHLVVCGLHA